MSLCALSRMDTPVSLLLAQLDGRAVSLRPVVQREAVPPAFPSLKKHVFQLQADAKDSVRECQELQWLSSFSWKLGLNIL